MYVDRQDLFWQVICAALVVSCLRLHAPAFVLVTLTTTLCLQHMGSPLTSSHPPVYGPHLPPPPARPTRATATSARRAEPASDRTPNPRKLAAQEKKQVDAQGVQPEQVRTHLTQTSRRHAAELPPLRDAESHRRLHEALARELPTRKPQPRLDDGLFASSE